MRQKQVRFRFGCVQYRSSKEETLGIAKLEIVQHFLQARCPSCHQINSIKAPTELMHRVNAVDSISNNITRQKNILIWKSKKHPRLVLSIQNKIKLRRLATANRSCVSICVTKSYGQGWDWNVVETVNNFPVIYFDQSSCKIWLLYIIPCGSREKCGCWTPIHFGEGLCLTLLKHAPSPHRLPYQIWLT